MEENHVGVPPISTTRGVGSDSLSPSNILRSPLSALLEYSGILRHNPIPIPIPIHVPNIRESAETTAGAGAGAGEVSIRIIVPSDSEPHHHHHNHHHHQPFSSLSSSSYQRYDIQHAARCLEQILPFSLLFLLLFIRQHFQDILVRQAAMVFKCILLMYFKNTTPRNYRKQVNAAGDLCAICQEKMHVPVLLRFQQSACATSSNSTKKQQQQHNRSVSDPIDSCSTPRDDVRNNNTLLYTHVIAFTLYELETITKSFRSDYILGEGGFGIVYKGYIDENLRVGLKSLPVAVKVLNKEGLQGHREWLTEVNFLGQLRHPNLVKLIGYCCEEDHRLLVYEFMFRGSLENHLFRKATVPLSWATRMMIALGAAKGLAFLHNAERPVIYRDFKTSNILLDSDYTAKLSDFGLAKAGPQGDETHVSTRVMGTYGYAAPEYVMTGHLTARSDVYSFGVVLLELLTGRKSVDKTRPGKEQSLVDWARPKLNDKRKLLQIIDPRLENQYSVRAAQKACSLAYYCLSQNPKARPLMSDVVETLEPLQSSSVGAGEVSLSGSNSGNGGGPFAMNKISDYRMRHKFSNNVGPGATCRSPNPNCSPGAPAACRVR
ncbi:hypothetical protein TanjilG_12112 [Lupinus angustifolius]|uniref:non-specific serine/threonine protein kinase n=1 Tax=Lupinus angustifolius TaxID=3871 RepID=A0A1J7GDP3_LUPAN|nr:hypothetical protein TanjilG_12112 [Lupinus angustifolius]